MPPSPEQLAKLETYLLLQRARVWEALQQDMANAPELVKISAELRRKGIEILCQYSADIKLVISENFVVPTDPVMDVETMFSDADLKFLKALNS